MKANKTSRIISMILVIAMVFTMTGVSAFADHNSSTDETKNVLVFAASTATGYGLANYSSTNRGFDIRNNDLTTYPFEGCKGRISEVSYPWRLKQYIQETENVPVDLSAMCINGMRTDELRALLDEKYYEAVYEWEYNTSRPDKEHDPGETGDIGYLTNHIREFVADLGDGGAKVDGVPVDTTPTNGRSNDGLPGDDGYRRASEYAKREIKNADVIVVDVCMNNFGTYMAERVGGKMNVPGKGYARNYYQQKVEDLPGVSETTLKLVNQFKNILSKAAPSIADGAAGEFVDAFTFCFAQFVTNFPVDIEMIREINPDAKIIVVGVYNTLDGVNLVFGDGEDEQKIPLGTVAGKGFDLVNTYIRGIDKNSNNYYFADVSGGIETCMDQIRSAESLEELMAPGTSGEALMNNMYDSFLGMFELNGVLPTQAEGVAKSYYDMVTEAFSGNGILLPKWSKSEEKVVGTTYAVYDLAQEELNQKIGLSKEPIEFTDTAGNLSRGLITQKADMLGQMLGIEDPTGEKVYNAIAQLFAQNGIALEKWSDKDPVNTDPITGKTYILFDTSAEEPADMFTPAASDDLLGATYLTQAGLADYVLSQIKYGIQNLLFKAGRVNDIHLDKLMNSLSDPAGMDNIKQEVMEALTGGAEPSQEVMELMHVVDRFLLYMGIGQHPSEKGCGQMYEDVELAYDKAQNGGNTAYEDEKEEIMALMAELKALLDNTPVGEDIDKIIETLDKIEAALPMLDEAQMTLEEINAIKAQFYDYYGQALDLLGITEEDLINQGKFIAENVDWEQLAEWIKKMNEIAQKYPELREKYEPIIREYADEIYDFVNKAMDEIIKAKDKIDVDKIMEYIQTAEDIIDQIEEVIKNAPTEDEIREKLEELQKIVEEKVKEISEELYEQLKAINEQLKEVVDGKTYEELLKELQPIMDQVKEMGIAIYKLPEYEKIIDEYAEVLATLGNDSAELKDEVSALLEQVEALKKQTEDKSAIIARLTAKAIDAEPKASVKFPKNTVKVVVSWDKDADAAGYEFKVNGKAKEFKETETGFTYEDTAVKIGTTYKYEVTPYVEYEGEKVYGMTFKTSVVPKVKLKKASIKKLKAGSKSFKVKWKKVSGASGYKVSYKLGKKTKNKTVKSGKKVSLKVKKLTSGKTYTVKVRAWKKVNGKKYYGKWSKAKKVTVK